LRPESETSDGRRDQKKRRMIKLEPSIVIMANVTAFLDIREQHLVKAPPK
jgi:hypothetical protein